MGLEGWGAGLKGVGDFAKGIRVNPHETTNSDGSVTQNPFASILPTTKIGKNDFSFGSPELMDAISLFGGKLASKKAFGGGDDLDAKLKLMRIADYESKIGARNKKGSTRGGGGGGGSSQLPNVLDY